MPHAAAGQLYGVSRPVAQYIGRNQAVLHRFANEDVTFGTWLVGLEVQYVDERRLCCDTEHKCGSQASDWGGGRGAADAGVGRVGLRSREGDGASCFT